MHGIYYKKATDVSEFGIKAAENAGGFTPTVIDTINYRMNQEHLDPSTFTLEHSNITKANFNQELEINVKGSYTYKTINLIGTGTGNLKKEINAPNLGKSTVWFRN